jgi:DNA-binding beta-propeller fold protein YncE
MSTLRATAAGNVRKNLVPWLLLALVTGPALAAGRDGSAAEVWATIRFPGPARVVFSPDSKLIALQRNDRVEVWDITSRKRLWAEAGAGDPMANFAAGVSLPIQFSPDGTLLAIAEGFNPTAVYQRAADDVKNLRDPAAIMQAMNPTAGIQLRGARTGTMKGRVGAEPVPDFNRLDCAILFAPDGKTILLAHFVQEAGQTLIETFGVASGKRLATAAAGGAYMLYRVAIAPDGRTLAAVVSAYALQRMGGEVVGRQGGGGPVLLAVWDLPRAKQRALLPMPAKQTSGTPLLFSRDGNHVVTAGPTGVTLWDVHHGRLMRTVTPEARKPTAAGYGESLSFPFLAWRPDGVTVVLSAGIYDARVWLYDLRARTAKAVPGSGGGNARPGGILSPNGTFALTVLRQNVGEAPPKQGKAAGNPAAANIKMRLEEEYILWDVTTGSKLDTLKPKETGEPFPVADSEHSIAFSPDESFVASAPANGVVTLWNIAAHRRVAPAGQDNQDEGETSLQTPRPLPARPAGE